MNPRIGVYVCHCGTNISAKVDVAAVAQSVSKLPGVVVCRECKYMCAEPGQELIKADIAEFGLDRVVVAACSPRLHEPTFRKALVKGGLNPYMLEMASIRELVSWVTDDYDAATAKAAALVRGAIRRVALHEPLEDASVPASRDVLVIGGGIAGITAALKLADAGIRVTLVERDSSIGGQMAKLDKTFPTMDSAAGMLTPKMVEVSQHPNIELLTLADVLKVEGFVGNFDVTVRQRPRFVDAAVCTGCGTCWDKCPKKVDSEFDLGVGKRKAIYLPFPQAVPNKPAIDHDNCTYFQDGKCRACEILCPTHAIRFDEREQVFRRRVGGIIVATGFTVPDIAAEKPQYGHKRFPGVYSGLEFERIVNVAGPTGGQILGRNGEPPKSVAVLHCIGSCDQERPYCSRICCMSALKAAHQVVELTGAQVYEFYTDMRAFGKGYEEFYEQCRRESIQFIRGKVAEVEDDGRQLIVRGEDTLRGVKVAVPVDMVVLSSAVVPQEDAGQMAVQVGVGRTADGFFAEAHPKLEPVSTATEGIYLAGACQGPRDIPDTVASAAGAAAEAIARLASGTVQLAASRAYVNPERCSGCHVCVPVCPYKAISFDDSSGVVKVTPAICKGCGTCVAACPSGAMHIHHFETSQILQQIEGVLAL